MACGVQKKITPRTISLIDCHWSAARSKRSTEGRDYLRLKLDDPSFTAPIYANLFDEEDGETFSLIWPRPNGRRGD